MLNTRSIMGQIFDPGRIFDLLSHDIRKKISNTNSHFDIFLIDKYQRALEKSVEFFWVIDSTSNIVFCKDFST